MYCIWPLALVSIVRFSMIAFADIGQDVHLRLTNSVVTSIMQRQNLWYRRWPSMVLIRMCANDAKPRLSTFLLGTSIRVRLNRIYILFIDHKYGIGHALLTWRAVALYPNNPRKAIFISALWILAAGATLGTGVLVFAKLDYTNELLIWQHKSQNGDWTKYYGFGFIVLFTAIAMYQRELAQAAKIDDQTAAFNRLIGIILPMGVLSLTVLVYGQTTSSVLRFCQAFYIVEVFIQVVGIGPTLVAKLSVNEPG
ncbi:hypothetical protein BKA62DRAFT_675330 [Auriculariales sp. MPI-PUGE-AT-0066]|nr:hypothetical protein BKA62DRAFT_675330 [Auriculariales sp. MPI-PUGE-AT-0066]